MNPKLLKSLSKKYGLEFVRVEKFSEHGYRNHLLKLYTQDEKVYTLLIYKLESGIHQIIKTTNHISKLYTDILPTRQVVQALDGSEIFQIKRKILKIHKGLKIENVISYYASIYNYLPGSTIPWEGWSMNHLKLLGKVMSKLHSIPISSDHYLEPITDRITREFKEIEEYLNDSGVMQAMKQKLKIKFSHAHLNLLASHLDILKLNLKPTSILHMDFVRGNILFDKKTKNSNNDLVIGNIELTGVIDFEKCGVGNPIIDIARTLSFLIIDCKYKNEEEIYKYFLESGYKKHGNPKFNFDKRYLKTLLVFFWLWEFYKFIKHNPYEALFQNEHFVRTRERLIHEGVVLMSKI